MNRGFFPAPRLFPNCRFSGIPEDMSEDNPWKTVSSRVVYENPWITVREDQVIRPDGLPGIYGVVGTRAATGVVALSETGDIYLVGQYRYPTEVYSWEIIEGGAEAGEAPLDAAKRELAEEAGLAAEEWLQLGGELQLSNCHSSEIGYLYLARKLRAVPSSPDGTEVLKLKKIPLAEAAADAAAGRIVDGMSVMGILLALRFLADGR